jgi:hypothetical protein
VVSEVDRDRAERLVHIEDAFWEVAFARANRVYYNDMTGPSVLVAYYYIRRNELKQLVQLSESLHYEGVC